VAEAEAGSDAHGRLFGAKGGGMDPVTLVNKSPGQKQLNLRTKVIHRWDQKHLRKKCRQK
jgi:hypothetical protein